MESATKFFSRHMQDVHGISIDERKLFWESVTFCREELDEQVVPVVDLQGFPDPLTIVTAISVDGNGNEWLFGVTIDERTGNLEYGWTVKNGQIVDRKLLLRLDHNPQDVG